MLSTYNNTSMIYNTANLNNNNNISLEMDNNSNQSYTNYHSGLNSHLNHSNQHNLSIFHQQNQNYLATGANSNNSAYTYDLNTTGNQNTIDYYSSYQTNPSLNNQLNESTSDLGPVIKRSKTATANATTTTTAPYLPNTPSSSPSTSPSHCNSIDSSSQDNLANSSNKCNIVNSNDDLNLMGINEVNKNMLISFSLECKLKFKMKM
jgi:hypothetical protein